MVRFTVFLFSETPCLRVSVVNRLAFSATDHSPLTLPTVPGIVLALPLSDSKNNRSK